MASSPREWESLPELVLDLILHKIWSLPDLVRFASVCSSWRSVSKTQPKRKVPIPMLLIPNKNRQPTTTTTTLYSVEDDKAYVIRSPWAQNPTRFCGSSHGWLAAVQPDYSIALSPQKTSENPNRPTIRLPPINDRFGNSQNVAFRFGAHSPPPAELAHQYTVRKLILSADPGESSEDYAAVAIYGFKNDLAILKAGDESWTCVDDDTCLTNILDAMWHKGKLYVASRFGSVFLIDGAPTINPRLIFFCPSNYPNKLPDHVYLAESSRSELLIVERFFNVKDKEGSYRCVYGCGHVFATSDFVVHKLESVGPMKIEERKRIGLIDVKNRSVLREMEMGMVGNVKKIKVDEIGGDALFIGSNYSVAVGAPKMSGSCRKNCIYYTDDNTAYGEDHVWGPIDHMGIFSLEKDTSLEMKHWPNRPLEFLVPPIWVTPMVSDIVRF